MGKGGNGKGGGIPKGDIPKWLATLAKNDGKHGRDSKDNPNNKPNGK